MNKKELAHDLCNKLTVVNGKLGLAITRDGVLNDAVKNAAFILKKLSKY